ncbi:MAG: methionine--tRNA ligase [Myxococcales bacterium]|nr:methionine--tRNA ligase [Myxococcales bacterium]
MNTNQFYVTTPIYYVNDVPHVGHAYTTLAADTLSRWHRLLGHDSYFLTGTDEHGLKIEQAARNSGVSPQEHADRYSKPFRDLCGVIDAQNNDFIRTTEMRHQKIVQEMWQRMEANGDIYLGEYAGWYSVSDEAYFTEDELINGKAPSGHPVEWVVEKSYFFRLSKYTDALLAHFEAHPDFVLPHTRANEIKRFVEQGLKDISISRTSFSWGVPVPNDKEHVTYVWVDALTNYISALGGPNAELYQKFWPSVHHIIGKDILRFHAVYWPCFLMSAKLPLPQQIIAHGWWTVEGEKMSKSKGNAIDPLKAVAAVGADAFRYFLLREIPFGSDGDFSQSALITRINSELANDYGNLLNRTLGMLKKYRKSVLPQEVTPQDRAWSSLEEQLLSTVAEARLELVKQMKNYRFHDALRAIWTAVSAGNKYVDSAAPWTLAKAGEDKAKDLDRVLYNLIELLRVIGVWTLPFLPSKSQELLQAIKVDESTWSFENTRVEAWGTVLKGGQELSSGLALFPRVEGPLQLTRKTQDPESTAESIEPKSNKNSKSKSKDKSIQGSGQAMIDFEDFTKLAIKVAVIVEAEVHPNADRLLKLTVDAGESELRTVCAGIAGVYQASTLIGKRVALLSNLKPRKIRGVLSQGMILAAGEGETMRLVEVPEGPQAGESIR